MSNSPEFEKLRVKMHGIPRKAPPGAWRNRPQTDEEATMSLSWCRRFLYEMEHFDDSEYFAVLRVTLRQRVETLQRRLGDDDDIPF